MDFLKGALLGGLALILTAPAQAVVIDFQAMSESGPNIGTFVTGEQGSALLSLFAAYGLMINITVEDTNPLAVNGAGFAYLDGPSGGSRGGLGACTFLNSTQCNPASDDNVSIGETLVFTFLENTFINNIVFNNNHDSPQTLDTNSVLVDGNGIGEIIFGVNDGGAGGIGPGGARNYTSTSLLLSGLFNAGDVLKIAYGGTNASKFYITSMTVNEVSAPGSAVLLLLGLGSLFLARRKVK
jgi:hypothetical protein